VKLNKDKYKKSVWLKFRYCLGVSQFPITLLIRCILAEQTAFEMSHFHTFQTSVTLTLTLDWVIWHTVVYHSSTSTYIPNFDQIGNFLSTDGFIMFNWRNQSKSDVVNCYLRQ